MFAEKIKSAGFKAGDIQQSCKINLSLGESGVSHVFMSCHAKCKGDAAHKEHVLKYTKETVS